MPFGASVKLTAEQHFARKLCFFFSSMLTKGNITFGHYDRSQPFSMGIARVVNVFLYIVPDACQINTSKAIWYMLKFLNRIATTVPIAQFH